MNVAAHELALIVCKQCKRNENESDIDFSTRLYSVYSSCFANIESLTPGIDINDSTEACLKQFGKMF